MLEVVRHAGMVERGAATTAHVNLFADAGDDLIVLGVVEDLNRITARIQGIVRGPHDQIAFALEIRNDAQAAAFLNERACDFTGHAYPLAIDKLLARKEDGQVRWQGGNGKGGRRFVARWLVFGDGS